MDATYAKNSTLQTAGNKLAKSFLSQVVLDTLSNGPIRFFAVADYGSSVGNNSVVELAEVVKAVAAQKGSEALPVTVTHVDQPGNDWTALFHTAASKADGYAFVRDPSNVFPFAVCGDMYKSCFPPASIHLVYSGYTFHWLSDPVIAPDHIWAERSKISSVRKKQADQADDDLRTLLTLRAAELQPGGFLVATFIASMQERSLTEVDPNWSLADVVYDCWLKLEQEGVISAAERDSFALGSCLRSLQSVQPVLDELSHLYAVHHLSVDKLPEGATGDPEDLSHTGVMVRVVQPFVAIFGPRCRQAIHRRTVQEQDRIMDTFKSALCSACIHAGSKLFGASVMTLVLKRKQ